MDAEPARSLRASACPHSLPCRLPHRSPRPAAPPPKQRGRRIHRGSLPEPVNEHVRRLHAASYRALDDALAPVVERARELFDEESDLLDEDLETLKSLGYVR